MKALPIQPGHSAPPESRKWRYSATACALIALVALVVAAILGCQGPTGDNGTDAAVDDSLGPVIEWLSPSPGAVMDTAATFVARAYDRIERDGVRSDTSAWRTVFYIAGLEFAAVPTDTNQYVLNCHWNATHYPEAEYPVSAQVWDLARNTTSTPVIFIKVQHH